MKFVMKQSTLAEAFGKMTEVATKGIKSEFKLAHRITIDVTEKKVRFLATNGHLDAYYDAPRDDCTIDTPGKVTVDANISNGIVQSIGDADDMIALWLVEENGSHALYLKNQDSDDKKDAKMQILSEGHGFTISKPQDKFSYTFKSDMFQEAIQCVAKYKSPFDYDIRFLMMCIHFLPKSIRFICGCGARFGVLEYSKIDEITGLKDNDKGDKYVMPAEQATIIASATEKTKDVKLIYKDDTHCYVECRNIKMMLKGIPEDKYLDYEIHAYRFDESTAVVEVPMERYAHICKLIGAVRDKEFEVEGEFHSCTFEASKDRFRLSVPEKRYQADSHCECYFYPVTDTSYEARYPHKFLGDLCGGDHNRVRFYCIDPESVILAESITVDEDDKKSRDPRVPKAKCPLPIAEEPKLTFFFASTEEKEEESG